MVSIHVSRRLDLYDDNFQFSLKNLLVLVRRFLQGFMYPSIKINSY